jgi:hypothetical protein
MPKSYSMRWPRRGQLRVVGFGPLATSLSTSAAIPYLQLSIWNHGFAIEASNNTAMHELSS